MTLNTKDPEAHRLAAAISNTTGQNMTQVVTDALQEKFERLQRKCEKASVEELLAFADRVAAYRKRPTSSDHADLLYDECGLPK